jgi:hypothetical protein
LAAASLPLAPPNIFQQLVAELRIGLADLEVLVKKKGPAGAVGGAF